MSGGDDADFWIANHGCRGTVATDAACSVSCAPTPARAATGRRPLRQGPGSAGPGQDRTLQIAALSGRGGELPQGPAGAKGDAGPQGPIGQGSAPATPPSIRRGKSRLRLSSRGTATVATIRCPQGSCRVRSRSARLKIGTRAYKIRVTGSRTIAAGKSAAVRVSVGKRVRRALRCRSTGALTVKLVIRSSNGASVSRTITVRLRAQ